MFELETLLLSLRNWFIYLASCISLPSVLLYCSECWLIIRHNAFHNSFYALFVVRAIPDLLYLLDSYYGYRLPIIFGDFLLPAFQAFPNWLLAIFYVGSSYTFLADNLATFFMLLNRLTAIALPMKHEKLWSKMLLPTIGTVFIVPLFFCVETFSMKAALVVQLHDPLNANGSSFLILEDSSDVYSYLAYNTRVTAICAVVFLVVCMLINAITFWAYRRRQRGQQLAKQNGNEAIERKLLVYALLTFLGHVLVAFLMIALYIYTFTGNNSAIQLIYSQYPWVVDFGTVVLPSWLLLWASPSFRQHWMAQFVPKWLHKGQKLVSNGQKAVKVSNVAIVHVRPSAGSNNTLNGGGGGGQSSNNGTAGTRNAIGARAVPTAALSRTTIASSSLRR